MALWRIDYNDQTLTDRLRPYFSGLSLSDSRGRDADDMSLSLIDPNAAIALPSVGGTLKLWIGTAETGLIYKGQFVIDSLEFSGPPDRVDIKASAADFTRAIKVKRELTYSDTTLGDIARAVAGRHDLDLRVGEAIGAVTIDHLTQANESDTALMNRLAKDYGGYFDIKDATLILSTEAIGTTAKGTELPRVTVTRTQTTDYRFTERSRENRFTGAKAAWRDLDSSEKIWEIAGTDDKIKALSEIFPNAAKAAEAAEAEFQRLQRGIRTMSMSFAHGHPAIIPETPVTLSGFKSRADQDDWIVTSVSHRIDTGGGYLSDIELETRSSTTAR